MLECRDSAPYIRIPQPRKTIHKVGIFEILKSHETLETAFGRFFVKKYTIDTAIVRLIQAPIKRIAPMNIRNRIW